MKIVAGKLVNLKNITLSVSILNETDIIRIVRKMMIDPPVISVIE